MTSTKIKDAGTAKSKEIQKPPAEQIYEKKDVQKSCDSTEKKEASRFYRCEQVAEGSDGGVLAAIMLVLAGLLAVLYAYKHSG